MCLADIDDDETVVLPVPVLGDDGDWDGITVEAVATTKQEYFDQISLLLREAGESFTLIEAIGALGVCPHGFIDAFSAAIVSLESDASSYHALPHAGGLLDQPAWLLDAMRAVRKAQGDYYLWRAEKRKRVSE